MNRLLLVCVLVFFSWGKLLSQEILRPPHDLQHIIVKLKSTNNAQRVFSKGFLADTNLDSWKPLLPQQQFNKGGKPSVLNGVYKVRLKKNTDDVFEIIGQLAVNPDVLYAEPI
ncbi:MAG: hypothetical protein AAFO69_19645, partial [Bacteroidota bacterium]